jgi:hypothetical protein
MFEPAVRVPPYNGEEIVVLQSDAPDGLFGCLVGKHGLHGHYDRVTMDAFRSPSDPLYNNKRPPVPLAVVDYIRNLGNRL